MQDAHEPVAGNPNSLARSPVLSSDRRVYEFGDVSEISSDFSSSASLFRLSVQG